MICFFPFNHMLGTFSHVNLPIFSTYFAKNMYSEEENGTFHTALLEISKLREGGPGLEVGARDLVAWEEAGFKVD